MDKKHRIFIKNMVCPRCIMAVETVMEKCGIRYMGVTLGEVTVEEPLTEQQLGMLEEHLQRLGFELLSDQRRQTVERICGGVPEWVGMTGDRPKLSTHLQARLSHEYSSLSKLFSEIKGMSIEQYMKLVRIERVKEIKTSVEEQRVTIIYNKAKATYEDFVKAFGKIGYTISRHQAYECMPDI